MGLGSFLVEGSANQTNGLAWNKHVKQDYSEIFRHSATHRYRILPMDSQAPMITSILLPPLLKPENKGIRIGKSLQQLTYPEVALHALFFLSA